VLHGLERRAGRAGAVLGPSATSSRAPRAPRPRPAADSPRVDESGQDARREPECTGDGEQLASIVPESQNRCR